jgi:hypothetical protein
MLPRRSLDSSLLSDGSVSPSLSLPYPLPLSLSPLHRLASRPPPLGTASPPSSSLPDSSPRHSSCPRPQVTCDSFCCIFPSRTREIPGCPRYDRCLRKIDPPAPETALLAPPRAARHRHIVPLRQSRPSPPSSPNP